jgi:HK97 family phage portal protein
MANPITRAIKDFRKTLSVAFYNGARLVGGGYRGDYKTFFTEMNYEDTDAGISVTADNALNYTAFWSCVTLLAGDVASLPMHLYRRKEQKGRERATEHPLYFLLHNEPNPEMDSYSFFESMMYHLCANNGNSYIYKEFEEGNPLRIKFLWLMDPDKVEKTRNGTTKEIEYLYQSDNGQITLPSHRVWHIPGFGFDGMIGYTPLTYARNLIGTARGAEKMGATLFKNGLTFGGYLEHPGKFGKEAQANWENQLKNKHQGVEKSHQVLILEEGMKYNKNHISPQDAQMLETQKYLYTRMASFFHIPPHKIGDLERATFSNIEEQNIEYVGGTLRRWLVRIEKSADRQLLLPTEKNDLYAEFLVDSLLRGNIESRYRAYAIGRNWGWLTTNRICEFENLEPISPEDGGDTYLSPTNMVPADKFDAMIPKPAENNQPDK